MKATFFKRYFLVISSILVVVSLFFSMRIVKEQAHNDVQMVYFLTARTDSVAASAGWISLRGGAGYVTCDGVALDVYFSLDDAQKARDRQSGVCDTLTINACAVSSDIPNAFLGCLQTIKMCLAALENGATQDSVRAMLEEQAELMEYLSQESGVPAIGKAVSALREKAQGTIYCNQLRYYLCETCESIAKRR